MAHKVYKFVFTQPSMTKKKAVEIKKGDAILIGGESLTVEEIEVSDIGKQGTKKVRIVARKKTGESIIIIRPEEYPLEVA